MSEIYLLKSDITSQLRICDIHRNIIIETTNKKYRRKNCGVPSVNNILKYHNTTKSGNRHVTPEMFQRIVTKTGIFIPIGTSREETAKENVHARTTGGGPPAKAKDHVTGKILELHHGAPNFYGIDGGLEIEMPTSGEPLPSINTTDNLKSFVPSIPNTTSSITIVQITLFDSTNDLISLDNNTIRLELSEIEVKKEAAAKPIVEEAKFYQLSLSTILTTMPAYKILNNTVQVE
ncbi:unnamed protein product [Mytilus coruscus]|uniref:Uncharacterized protein n=1 Tax=Mytilus coruscus TaxID=42192 RepID=A0A6J8E6B1_MYTCO|nr:unnamed protein product [Mytilus coruscus]